MRRFAWQIGGVTAALVVIVVLAILAFARPSSGTTLRPTGRPSASPRASATVDARVAEVEAAARRYIEALDTAMQTGSPQELDSLSVPGSQAEGDAGASAHVVHNKGRAFVVTSINVTSITADVNSSSATAAADYTITGYDATWPSLQPLDSSHDIQRHTDFQFELIDGQWLVDVVR